MSKARASSVQATPMGSKAIHKYFSFEGMCFHLFAEVAQAHGLSFSSKVMSLLRVFRSLLAKS